MARQQKAGVAPGNAIEKILGDPALVGLGAIFDASLTRSAEREGGIAPWLSTEGDVFTDKATQLDLGKSVEVVILATATDYRLYPTRYVKGEVSSAVCFYIGTESHRGGAAPHPTAPQPQAAKCGDCIKNTFGSGVGNSKACKQYDRLLVLLLGEGEDPAGAPLRRLRVPPTSGKHLSRFLKVVRALPGDVPVQAIVCKIEIADKELSFTPLRAAVRSRADVDAIARRLEEGRDALFEPPTVSDVAATPAPAKRGGGRRVVNK